MVAKRNIKLLLWLAISALCPMTALGQPPAEFQSHGFPAYIVNYGAVGRDLFRTDFAARNFIMSDEQSSPEGRQMRAINPALWVIGYRCMVSVYPSMTNYATEVNPFEEEFLHSCDPACLAISRSGAGLRITWAADRRYGSNQGYLLLVASADSSTVTVWGDSILHHREAVIAAPPWGGDLCIATIDSAGDTLGYSAVWHCDSTRYTSRHLGIDSIAFATGTAETLRVRLHLHAPLPDSCRILVDINHNRAIEVGERIRIPSSPDTLWSAEVTWPRDAAFNAGRGFRILAYRGAVIDTFPRGFYATTNVNNRVRSDPYGNYLMNPASDRWRAYTVDQIRGFLAGPDYNGVFTDNTTIRVQTWMYEVPSPLFDYDTLAWERGTYLFLDSVTAAAAPGPVFFNGLGQTQSVALLPHSSGGMFEGWLYSNWSGYATPSYWTSCLNSILITRHTYHRIHLALPQAPAEDTLCRLYCYGSYLLAADDSAWYANADDYQLFAHFPEMGLPMGAALDTAATAITDLQQGALYIRRFEHGTVVVNPSTSTQTLTGSYPPYLVHLTPGTTLEGSRVVTARSAPGTIAARSAAIFMTDSIASPEIRSIAFDPASPCDTCANRVMAEVISPGTLYVEAALESLGVSLHLIMRDDGLAGDDVAGDGTFTGTFELPLGIPAGQRSLHVLAANTFGLVAVRPDSVDITLADTLNLLPNWSFEYDLNHDAIPDQWHAYMNGFAYDTTGAEAYSGHRSVRCQAATGDSMYGIYYALTLNQVTARDVVVSGWSKALGVGGSVNNDYAIYCDCSSDYGPPLYGQCARFAVGTHDWQYAEVRIHPTVPITRISIYALFRRHVGQVWFDHLAARNYVALGVEATASDSDAFEAQPNPFSSVLRISGLRTGVDIHDLDGHLIARLDGRQGEAIWMPGKDVSPGIYFLRSGAEIKRIVRIGEK